MPTAVRTWIPALALVTGLVSLAGALARGTDDSTLLRKARPLPLPFLVGGYNSYAWRTDDTLTILERKPAPLGFTTRALSVNTRTGKATELAALNREMARFGSRHMLDRSNGDLVISGYGWRTPFPRRVLDLNGKEILEIPPDPAGMRAMRFIRRDGDRAALYSYREGYMTQQDLKSGATREYRFPAQSRDRVAGFQGPDTFVTVGTHPRDRRTAVITIHSMSQGAAGSVHTARLPHYDLGPLALISPDGRRMAWLVRWPATRLWGRLEQIPLLRAVSRRGEVWIVLISDADGSGLREAGRYVRRTDSSPRLEGIAWKPDSRTLSFTLDGRLYEVGAGR